VALSTDRRLDILPPLLLGASLWTLWKLPGLLQGRAQFGVLREGQGGQISIGLSLSLPPLPDPALLEALDGTPITIFVSTDSSVGLLNRLRTAGHELGLPGQASRHFDADRAQLEAGSGQPISLLLAAKYHPFTLMWARRAGLRPVWPGLPGTPGELLAQAEPGGLLNLDGLSAEQLGELLTELRVRGYQPVPVGQLRGLRSETLRGLLQRLYRRFIDARFDRQHGTVALTQRARGLFRISKRPYGGPPLTLTDGSVLSRGTPAAELHIYSKRLVALAELSALTGLRGVQSSLHDVAQALEERPEFRDVQLIYALTIFGGVLGTMGFQTEPLPGRRQARLMAVFFNLLRVLYGAKNTDSQVLLPAVIWMSRETLMARYGKNRARTRS
jgi:peptidoglycan-N-acetylglucosamine deacetylase